jgi:hypothetical protein
MVVEPSPSSNPFNRPRKTTDKAKILPNFSTLSISNPPDCLSQMDISSTAPTPLFRPRKTHDMSRALDKNSDVVMGPTPAAERASETQSSPVTVPTVFRQRKTVDQSKVLRRSTDIDVIMSPSTADISHVEMAHPPVARPAVFRQRRIADPTKVLPTYHQTSRPHIPFHPVPSSGSGESKVPTRTLPFLRPRKTSNPLNTVAHPPAIIPAALPTSSVTAAPAISSATTSVPDETFGRLRIALYAHAAAVRAFVRSITLPRFRHYVDNIPYTSPTGVSSNAARYPGLSSGGKSSHIYFVSAFMCCNFQVDL